MLTQQHALSLVVLVLRDSNQIHTITAAIHVANFCEIIHSLERSSTCRSSLVHASTSSDLSKAHHEETWLDLARLV